MSNLSLAVGKTSFGIVASHSLCIARCQSLTRDLRSAVSIMSTPASPEESHDEDTGNKDASNAKAAAVKVSKKGPPNSCLHDTDVHPILSS